MLLRYRGSEGMLAWAFHRISGVAIWAFILLHVLDIWLVGVNPELYDEVLAGLRQHRPDASWKPSSAPRCSTTRSTASGS